MKNSKYKIVVVISLLLVVLSLSITTVNYFVSLKNTQNQLKTQSLPLSLDNIYTVIQKHIIQPYLVSSMMANDTFVHNWIHEGEEDAVKIKQYLSSIKNKYGMFTSFLVSDKSGNYYNQNGIVEKIKSENPNNKWYFKFKDIEKRHEINLDFNEHLSNSLVMFINYKIIDPKFNFLGATGVGLKISYIDEMLKMFRLKHHFKVFFVNSEGKIVLSERSIITEKSIDNMKYLKEHKELLLSKEPSSIEYEKVGSVYLLNTKFIPELNLYLLVEAKLDDFTKNVKKIFYLNLFVSFFISLIVIIITIYLIKNYNKRLEYLAGNDQLTQINNRRLFEQKLLQQIDFFRRDKKDISLFFMDVDDFKNINDKHGHEVGDKVLVRIASILKENIRKTDLLARWGGEEFVCAYIDSTKDDANFSTNKIKELIHNDLVLKGLVGFNVTASFGLTQLTEEDNIDSIITRADSLMYKSKEAGKNRVFSNKG